MAKIIHIVLFQFKAQIQAPAVAKICDHMLSLQRYCIHPETKKPYIKSVVGGLDNSPESAQHGMTHGFVVEFDSDTDRDYYVKQDPVHQEFMKAAAEVLEGATVLDFEPGKF